MIAAAKPALEVLSVLCAAIAASLWFLSARVSVPQRFPIRVQIIARPLHDGPGSPPPIGEGRSEELNLLARALAKQSRLSAWAAFFAGLAALFQALAWLMPAPSS